MRLVFIDTDVVPDTRGGAAPLEESVFRKEQENSSDLEEIVILG